MGKRRASTRRENDSEEIPQREVRTKHRHDSGSTSRYPVNSSFTSLFRNQDRLKVYKEKFQSRHILEYKHVNFTELIKMYENQNIDTADYLASHGWNDFVQVHRPVYKTLLRILISNLDESNMQSWIGNTPVDLSEDAWCRIFNLPLINVDDEHDIMDISKEELFFRLTGEANLGLQPFIKINQLHQEANVRLSAQVVMTVLVPKKGSKEQVKVEEGRLLYAMIYGKKINLAKLIVERIKAAMGRKSIPICYGMHLMEIMAQAGVDLTCIREEETVFSSAIDHHTLRRLGYKLQLNTWVYVGRGRVTATFQSEPEDETGAEGDQEGTAQAESAAPSQPPPRSSSTSFYLASQISNLATKTEIAHLRQFMVEQFHLLQATLMSKLESMDSRLHACETQLLHQHRTTAAPTPSHPFDPKGKGPMVSPGTSPTTSPAPTPHISSPSAHKSPPPDPIAVPSHSSSHSSSSSSSSHSEPQQFEIAARTPVSPSHHSQDSEATPSDPARFIVTPPPSPPPPPPPPHSASTPLAITPSSRTKQAAIKNASYTPSPPSPPPSPLAQPTSSSHPTLTPYTRRKLAVSRPGISPPPPPS